MLLPVNRYIPPHLLSMTSFSAAATRNELHGILSFCQISRVYNGRQLNRLTELTLQPLQTLVISSLNCSIIKVEFYQTFTDLPRNYGVFTEKNIFTEPFTELSPRSNKDSLTPGLFRYMMALSQ